MNTNDDESNVNKNVINLVNAKRNLIACDVKNKISFIWATFGNLYKKK